jgi:hypothetical protein
MAGLDPAIQTLTLPSFASDRSAWMAGSSPAMTGLSVRAQTGAAGESMENTHGA